MTRELYTCPVCGKTLKLAGTRNIELHERSAFHKAAMKSESKPDETIKPVQSIALEGEPEIKGIQTTVPEVNNVKNKETTDRIEDRNEGSTDDTDEFTGYLC